MINRIDQYEREKKSVKTARILSIFWPIYCLYLKNIEGAALSAILLATVYVAIDPLTIALAIHAVGIIVLQDNVKGSVKDYNLKLYKRIFYVKTTSNSGYPPRAP